MILDPDLAEQIRTERDNSETSRYDEVWDGVLVVSPTPNTQHQRILSILNTAFSCVIDWDNGDQSLPGINLSDRHAKWKSNYREPDIAVYLASNPAKDYGSHWVGGPDLAVEIVSPGEEPHKKLEFYAKVNTHELLIVDRDPWSLELYKLRGRKLVLAGKSELKNKAVLVSRALPLTFKLQPGTPRPKILVTHPATKQTWAA
jgi:Uma2 family endonuclease